MAERGTPNQQQGRGEVQPTPRLDQPKQPQQQSIPGTTQHGRRDQPGEGLQPDDPRGHEAGDLCTRIMELVWSQMPAPKMALAVADTFFQHGMLPEQVGELLDKIDARHGEPSSEEYYAAYQTFIGEINVNVSLSQALIVALEKLGQEPPQVEPQKRRRRAGGQQ